MPTSSSSGDKPKATGVVTQDKVIVAIPRKSCSEYLSLVERFKAKLEEIAPSINLPTKARDGGLLNLLKEAAEGDFNVSALVCEGLKNLHMTGVTEPDQSSATNAGGIKDGSSTQAVKQKAHFDVSPVLPGEVVAGKDDPTVNGPTFHKQDDGNNGKSPIIEYKWTVDGKEASNSAEMPDPFHLGSYEDNGGCTPSLKLETPVGEGRHLVQMYAFIRPEYNGGTGVQSNTIQWYCD